MIVNKTKKLLVFLPVILIFFCLDCTFAYKVSQAQEESAAAWITGDVYDAQNQPVEGVEVTLVGGNQENTLAVVETQANGNYSLSIPSDGKEGFVLVCAHVVGAAIVLIDLVDEFSHLLQIFAHLPIIF